MIHFNTDLRDTKRAIDVMRDHYSTYIDDNTISYEATDYFVVDNEGIAQDIAWYFEELNITFTAEKDCDECCGDGFNDVMNCHDSSNECCGGCYKEVECESCDSGKICFI